MKNIEDVLVIDDTEIPIQFHVQNWGSAFDRELLKIAVTRVLKSDSLSISTIDNIDTRCELVQYQGDKHSTGTMENIVIKMTFKTEEVKCFAITSILPINIEEHMPLKHVDYKTIECK